MHAEAAVDACAREADEDAEFWGGPLRRGRIAIATKGVAGFLLNGEELFGWMVVSAGHWASGGKMVDRCQPASSLLHTFDRVSGSTSHMAFEAMTGSL